MCGCAQGCASWKISLGAGYFSPIFFANLIYSTTFRDTKQANVAFGANLLGTVVGGAAEYFSLLTGYQALVILAGLFYFAAFFFFRRMRVKASL